VWGPLHLFALNSDYREPDGHHQNSTQAMWLRDGLAASVAPWKLVYMHVPPYSSGLHGSAAVMQWPYAEWGATAVLAGHDHTYERLLIDGFPYFVNGLGGYPARYPFGSEVEGSQIFFNEDYGAMLVEATETTMTFQFITRTGAVIDTYQLTRP
jgi:tartrate-resistant acid phosphatase type 5